MPNSTYTKSAKRSNNFIIPESSNNIEENDKSGVCQIIYGVPGSGKSYYLDNDILVFKDLLELYQNNYYIALNSYEILYLFSNNNSFVNFLLKSNLIK